MSLRFTLHRAAGKLASATGPDVHWAVAWCVRIGIPFALAGALFAAAPIALLWWWS